MKSRHSARPRLVTTITVIAVLSTALASAVPGALSRASGPMPVVPGLLDDTALRGTSESLSAGGGVPAQRPRGRDLLPHATLNGAIYFGHAHQAQAEEVAALLLMLVAKAQAGSHPVMGAASPARHACTAAPPARANRPGTETATKMDSGRCSS